MKKVAKKTKKVVNKQANTTDLLKELSPRNLFILVSAVSMLLIAFSGAYYLTVALPNIQNKKIEFERDKFEIDKFIESQQKTDESDKKEQNKLDLELCLDYAVVSYGNNWKKDCEIHKNALEKNFQECADSRNDGYNNCKNSGLSEEYCESSWLSDRDSDCRSKYEYNEDGDSCLLPSSQAEDNEDRLVEKKEECYKKFEVSK